MRKGIAVLAAAALVVLAFVLPEWLSTLHDRKLLDNPSIQVQSEEPEGFAESIQLTVAEKIALLRGGTLSAMQLGQEEVEGVYVNHSGGGEFTVNIAGTELVPSPGPEDTVVEEEISAYIAELNQTWKERVEAVQAELRSLQAVGGMPELWSEEETLDCSGYGELLYIDPDSRMSFQVYHMTLTRNTLSLRLMVDLQSGRILSFSLRWGRDDAPVWGLRGAANFGGVWRNYWGLDSVSSGWYDDNTRNILECTEDRNTGDYTAQGQIAFTYNSQSLPVPLECESVRGRSFALRWNI